MNIPLPRSLPPSPLLLSTREPSYHPFLSHLSIWAAVKGPWMSPVCVCTYIQETKSGNHCTSTSPCMRQDRERDVAKVQEAHVHTPTNPMLVGGRHTNAHHRITSTGRHQLHMLTHACTHSSSHLVFVFPHLGQACTGQLGTPATATACCCCVWWWKGGNSG
jgi:hypothetical protein